MWGGNILSNIDNICSLFKFCRLFFVCFFIPIIIFMVYFEVEYRPRVLNSYKIIKDNIDLDFLHDSEIFDETTVLVLDFVQTVQKFLPTTTLISNIRVMTYMEIAYKLSHDVSSLSVLRNSNQLDNFVPYEIHSDVWDSVYSEISLGEENYVALRDSLEEYEIYLINAAHDIKIEDVDIKGALSTFNHDTRFISFVEQLEYSILFIIFNIFPLFFVLRHYKKDIYNWMCTL